MLVNKMSEVIVKLSEPHPDTAENVHKTVIELLKDKKIGRVLDAGQVRELYLKN